MDKQTEATIDELSKHPSLSTVNVTDDGEEWLDQLTTFIHHAHTQLLFVDLDLLKGNQGEEAEPGPEVILSTIKIWYRLVYRNMATLKSYYRNGKKIEEAFGKSPVLSTIRETLSVLHLLADLGNQLMVNLETNADSARSESEETVRFLRGMTVYANGIAEHRIGTRLRELSVSICSYRSLGGLNSDAPLWMSTNSVDWDEQAPGYITNKDAITSGKKAGQKHDIDDLNKLDFNRLRKLLRSPGCRIRYMSQKYPQPRGRVHQGDWNGYLKTQIDDQRRFDTAVEKEVIGRLG